MIDVERRERVVHLVLDAPPVNVLDRAILTELTDRLSELAGDESIAAVVLSGAGRCFSAGASVAEHSQELAEGMLTALADACLALPAFPAPVIGAVHGACLGGAMELVAFCDFVVAAPDAKLGQPEIKLAFLPPVACHQLPRLTGMQNAAYAILTGESLDAERAQALGLVQEILPREEWTRLDDRFNGLSAPVLRLTKQALARKVLEGCAERLDAFKELFLTRLYGIEDVAEGIASFTERRRPEWRHR